MENSSPESTLKLFETHYLSGDYKSAKTLLLQNKDSFDSKVFHYNLGTLYLKDKEFAVGRYHLEKAIKDGFLNTRILNNLDVAKDNLGVAQIENNIQFGDQVFENVITTPLSIYFSITLLLFFIVIFLKRFFKNKIVMVFVLLVCLCPLVMSVLAGRQYSTAIALKAIIVKEGPSDIFQNKAEIPAGIKLIVKKPKDGWFFVDHPKVFSGWIKGKNLGVL